MVVFVAALAVGCSSDPSASPPVDAGSDHDLGSRIDAGRGPDSSTAPPGLWIDGEFEDWADAPARVTDPAGDATGPFDLVEVRATSRGRVLYLQLTLDQPLNLHSGPSGDRTLVLRLGLPTGRQLTVDFRARRAVVDEVPPREPSWAELGHLVAPTHASTRFEMTFDLAGLAVPAGREVSIDFAESDALPQPLQLTLDRPEQPAVRRTADRQPETTLRVASLNVLLDGLLDGQRGPQIGRLIKAVQADIYCFQEAYEPQATTLARGLQQLDPHGDGVPWQVYQNVDLIIASRGAIHPLPVGVNDGWHAAAVVELGKGRAVLVLDVHPPCCGYSGSEQDAQRIAITEWMVQQIGKFRGGDYGPPLDAWREVPVIVVGDWNLVGSARPLELMLDPAGPALQRRSLRHLVGGHTYTSRSTPDKQTSFPPGLLDLLVHSPGLVPRHGFVLQSEELERTELQRLGLQADDSLASDHLLLVADFQLPR
jgi:endonuclease/exonuclease/phosphatase family metal-dependent hydrolase